MSLWTVQQREWLQALGHPVLVLAADEEAPPPIKSVGWPDDFPVALARPQAVREVTRSPPARPGPAVETAEVATSGIGVSAHRLLQRALLRATGQRTTRAAEDVLAGLNVDAAALREDASAKRALWVRLRALRRGAGRP